METDSPEYRTVVALNKKHEVGRLLNSLGHVVLGLGGNAIARDDLKIQEYQDADGVAYPNISYHPVIVLKADNGNHLRRFRDELEQYELPMSSFVHTMFEGGTPAQLAATAQTPSADLDYVAVATFGSADVLRPLTKRFRLFT